MFFEIFFITLKYYFYNLWQTSLGWKNLKAYDGFLHPNNDLIGILSCQVPQHGIYDSFMEQNLKDYFALVLVLSKVISFRIGGIPHKEMTMSTTPEQFLFL